MNRHQNSERHHTTNKTNSFHFEDAYVNLAYENNSDSPMIHSRTVMTRK